jgi:hypothetical protein
MAWEDQKKLSDTAFKELPGVKRETFERMLAILEKECPGSHKNGGRPPKLSACDRLRITLQYLREYRTMFHIACGWGIAKSTVCEIPQWVEETLGKDRTFKLPGKRILKRAGDEIQYIVVDVTESPAQRPKKTKRVLSGEKEAAHDKDAGDNQPGRQEDCGCQVGERERP